MTKRALKEDMPDIYFRPEYGSLYEQIEGGVCETFLYRCEAGTVRHMFIKRPLPWLIDGKQYYDIVTPYGYGGPVIVEGEAAPALLDGYFEAWGEHCRNENIVCEFMRFHLFDNIPFRERFPGEVIRVSDNVVRELDKDMDAMWMEFEHKVRKNVKKAQSNGLVVTADESGEHLSAFLDIYYRTMERNRAKEYYYFDRGYFRTIIDTLPGQFMFFHVWHDGLIVSTELVLCSERYVYSFLGGTLDEYYPMRPNDLLKYEIIKWAKEGGHQSFILGGGYGANDGIYRYKKAFAPGEDVPFYVGRMIWNADAYKKAVALFLDMGGTRNDFFPEYRG